MEDFGSKLKLTVFTDSTAAKGMTSWRGLGKVRHVEVNQLWIQDKVGNGEVDLKKVPGSDNLADAMTKHVEGEQIHKHLTGTGQYVVPGRHSIMPAAAT